MARSTVFSYKGKESNAQKVGRELNVDAVLTGRVAQRGDTLTIQTDLVSVADGSELWGQQYNRRVADFLNVQEDISNEISTNSEMPDVLVLLNLSHLVLVTHIFHTHPAQI